MYGMTIVSRDEQRLQRARAAQDGWQTRRQGKSVWRRFVEEIPHLDPAAARLFACSQAESVLPLFTAAHPDEPRPALILWTARRYACGEANDRERLGVRQVALALARQYVIFPPRTPAEHALYATLFCLDKSPTAFLWAVEVNVGQARGDAAGFREEFAAAALRLPRKGGVGTEHM